MGRPNKGKLPSEWHTYFCRCLWLYPLLRVICGFDSVPLSLCILSDPIFLSVLNVLPCLLPLPASKPPSSTSFSLLCVSLLILPGPSLPLRVRERRVLSKGRSHAQSLLLLSLLRTLVCCFLIPFASRKDRRWRGSVGLGRMIGL